MTVTWSLVSEEYDATATEQVVTEQYVVTADAGETVIDVKDDAGAPKVGDVYTDLPALRCRRRRVGRGVDEGGKKVYKATVEWARSTESEDPDEPDDNPFDDPPDIDYGVVQSEEPVYVDRDGSAIRNSAGQPYDPPPTKTLFDPVVTYERNEQTWPAAARAALVGAANSGFWNGYPPGKWRCLEATARTVHEGGTTYYRTRYVFGLRLDGWNVHLLDYGYAYRDENGKLVVPADDTGKPLNEKVLLDGNGGKLEAGQAVFNDYELVDEVDFDPLGIDF